MSTKKKNPNATSDLFQKMMSDARVSEMGAEHIEPNFNTWDDLNKIYLDICNGIISTANQVNLLNNHIEKTIGYQYFQNPELVVNSIRTISNDINSYVERLSVIHSNIENRTGRINVNEMEDFSLASNVFNDFYSIHEQFAVTVPDVLSLLLTQIQVAEENKKTNVIPNNIQLHNV